VGRRKPRLAGQDASAGADDANTGQQTRLTRDHPRSRSPAGPRSPAAVVTRGAVVARGSVAWPCRRRPGTGNGPPPGSSRAIPAVRNVRCVV